MVRARLSELWLWSYGLGWGLGASGVWALESIFQSVGSRIQGFELRVENSEFRV